ncbi:MAG: glycoside hydrolase [Acidilobus sp.]
MNRAGSLLALALALAVVLASLSPLALFTPSGVRVAKAQQSSGQVYSNFTVSFTGYLTVYLYGINPASKALLWWGIEPYPQGPWYTVNGTSGNMETPMTYNSTLKAFVATVGPFKNGTYVAYVFNVNSTIWINYDNHAFWNWNVLINPPLNITGYTRAWVLPNGSIEITAIGRPPDTMVLWYGLTSGPQTGLPWYTTVGTSGANQSIMAYNPLWGNYSAVIGPFKPGQWVQWVYHDANTGWWLHDINVSSSANFAIQDVYTPVHAVTMRTSQLVYMVGQEVTMNVTVQNVGPAGNYSVALQVGPKIVANETATIPSGYSNLTFSFPANFPMGIYNVFLLVGLKGVWQNSSVGQLYVINTTARKPLSVVIVWNMHQPLYLEPNGSWGQPWVQLHTGQDLVWNGQLVGAYELQAMLLNQFKNINVTIDFTPVLLYQWEAFTHQTSPTFLSPWTSVVQTSHDVVAVNETLTLYEQLVREGRLQVLTVPFYHPLQALVYDNGWQPDLLAQLLMGKQMTYDIFDVNANGVWTPEMGFNMGLIWLYADAGINATVLDYQAFVTQAPALTVVSGNTSLGPYGIYVVENSLGQKVYLLFRDTTLSNMFSFIFFSQSPSLTQQEFLQYLVKIYMQHPGAVVVVALDGENPIIFNPMPQSAQDLYAIYQALSEAEHEGWLVTQTVNQAVETHQVAAVLTNLPEESWATNLNNWNNGALPKVYIWDNVSVAREYLVAYSNLLGMPVSPEVSLSYVHAPNASISAFEAMTGQPAYVTIGGVSVPNPLYMYYTLWNYLYVSEGSDWFYAAGPPNSGPHWFWVQPVIYDQAIVGYVKQAFTKIAPFASYVNGAGQLTVGIYNNLTTQGFHVPAYVYLVVSNGTANVSEEVELPSSVNYVTVSGLRASPGSSVTVYLYAPVTQQQLGAYLVPISSYGILIGSYPLSVQPITTTTTTTTTTTPTTTVTTSTTFTVTSTTTSTTTVTASSPTPSTVTTTVTRTSTPYLFAVVAVVIVAVIVAVVIGLARK